MNDEALKGDDPVFEFEAFRLDASKRLLFKDEEQISLMPKALDILFYLVTRAGEVAEKSEIMDAVWPDTAVEENNLTQNISALRRALGEKHRENRYIATVPGRGYKFVAPVRRLSESAVGDEGFPEVSSGEQHASDSKSSALGTAKSKRWPAARIAALAVLLVLTAGSAAALLFWRSDEPSVGGKIGSMAVLPFKPLVAEKRDESLELGMADSLIAKLSTGQVRVRPLGAVRRFGGTDQDPQAAGRELQVEAVLDGSIQIENDRVRVLAKLIKVDDGRQLWAGKFNETSSDIFALQDSISQRVAMELQIVLGERARKNYTSNVQAYQLFARGKFHAAKLVYPEVQKGIAYFEQAIAVDPNYAMAYVELANAYRAMVLTNDARPNDVMPKGRDAAVRAAELDPGLAEAHTVLGFAAFWYEFDAERAERHYVRALELDPESIQSHFGYAHLLSNVGRHDEAVARIRRTLELDPVNLVANALYGQILFFAGDVDGSLRVLQATAEMDRTFWLVHLFMSRAYAAKGMWDESASAAEHARDLTNGNAEAIAGIGYAHARAGRTAEARRIIAVLEGRSNRYVPPYAIAAVYSGLNEHEKALELLERSYAERDALMVFLKVEPKWDGLRGDPRFMDLMRRMGLD